MRERGGLLDVRVVPRADRPGIAGMRGGALLVRLSSPPVGGAANRELVETLARALRCPTRDVELVSGRHTRAKRVRIAGLAREQVLAALGLHDT